MKTKVVNLKTAPKGTYIYIGRGSIFGNPFIIGKNGTREEVIEKYKHYFYKKIATDEGFKSRVLRLYGKTLGCFCKPLACHGDIIVEYLENLTGDNK